MLLGWCDESVAVGASWWETVIPAPGMRRATNSFSVLDRVQPQREKHLEHLRSLGLPYIKRFNELTGDEQRDLFLQHVYGSVVRHFESDFLSDALSTSTNAGCIFSNCELDHFYSR